MTSFRDKTGSVWYIELNVGTVRRLRSRLALDFRDAGTPPAGKDSAKDFLGAGWIDALSRVSEDPELLGQALYCLVGDEARKRGVVSEDGFLELLSGDALPEAADALTTEIVNFSHPAKRPILRAAATKMAGESKLAVETVEKAVAAAILSSTPSTSASPS